MAKKKAVKIPFRPKRGKVNTSPKLKPGRKPKQPPEVSVGIEPLEDVSTPLDLGEIVLPTQAEALKVLQELAQMNDAVLQAQKRYADAAARAKRLKGEWDDLAAALSKRLRYATHKAPTPLFDQAEEQRKRDEAIKNQITPAAEPGEQFPAADGAAEGVEATGDPSQADPGSSIADEEVPF